MKSGITKSITFLIFTVLLYPGIFPANSQDIRNLSTAQQYNSEERPWVWWFWLGSIASEEIIDRHLEEYAKAGYGGINIIASYSPKGYNDKQIPYRSKRWYEMIQYTVKAAAKLNMGVDMAFTSAWPFGGPQVKKEDGAMMLKDVKSFDAKLSVNEQVFDPKNDEYIIAVSAFDTGGSYLDLTSSVGADGKLVSSLPTGSWNINAVTGGYTGMLTKRSTTGGEGLVLDYFDGTSMDNYTRDFDKDLGGMKGVRSLFNDSYEVYGADYTKTFLTEFEHRRGYSPKPYLPMLFSDVNNEITERFLCDYRATIADLILENFMGHWNQWSHSKGFITTEQAHGSPSNLIDMYAAADIPQCESFGPSCFDIEYVRWDADTRRDPYKWPDILHFKFASSGGNLMGRRLVSSETATWLTNHFRMALSQVKPEIDKLYIGGINHIMLISATNTPFESVYPGWVFYPAPDFGPRSAVMSYMPDFSLYTARIQNILQNTKPDNDVLLYYPVYDYFSTTKKDLGVLSMMDHIPTKWGYDWPFAVTARKLKDNGYQFDYISDKILAELSIEDHAVRSKGGTTYNTIVIPACRYIPNETMAKLIELSDSGINIVFDGTIPSDIPGLNKVSERLILLNEQKKKIVAKHNVFVTANIDSLLRDKGVKKAGFSEAGLEYIRKSYGSGKIFFVANQKNIFSRGVTELDGIYKEVVAFDAMKGKKSRVSTTIKNGKTVFDLELLPGESIILFADCGMKATEPFYYYSDKGCEISGNWKITFEKGEPYTPAPLETDRLVSWTEIGDTTHVYYHGTGIYSTTFNLPETLKSAKKVKMQFSDVRDMAEIWINGKMAGRTWSAPYNVEFDARLLKEKDNIVSIKVTNISTNRMIWMDRHNVPWKEVYVADPKKRDYNTSDWEIAPSGLVGPVRLIRGETQGVNKSKFVKF